MSFFKNILKLLLLVGLTVYLVYVFVVIPTKSTGEKCQNLNVLIADSMYAGFVTKDAVADKLTRAHLHPVGTLMDSVNCQRIEQQLTKDAFIRNTVCYKSPLGVVNVIVEQRLPILRVMADNGENYYIDDNGFKMKPNGYEADLVVVTGSVDDQFMKKYLVPLGLYLKDDPFWNDQLEQIYVTPNKELQLFPRVGEHIINAGAPIDMETKLANLRLFYEKVLSKSGWNMYKEITIAYQNQIVCKK